MIYVQGRAGRDESFNEAIVSSVKFKDSKAYEAAVARAMRLGLTQVEAERFVSGAASSKI